MIEFFCIELEKYRPSELGSIKIRIAKTLGGTYKRYFFFALEKRHFG